MMALMYVSDEVHKRLKARAAQEDRSMAKVISRMLDATEGDAGDVRTSDARTFNAGIAAVSSTFVPLDPRARWDAMATQLTEECGVIFTDDLEVKEVVDPERFKKYNGGALYRRYLERGGDEL